MLFPTLTAKPFHDNREDWAPMLTEAVDLLERFAPVIRDELLALRGGTGFQQFRGRNEARESAKDGSISYLFAPFSFLC